MTPWFKTFIVLKKNLAGASNKRIKELTVNNVSLINFILEFLQLIKRLAKRLVVFHVYMNVRTDRVNNTRFPPSRAPLFKTDPLGAYSIT